MKTVGTRIEVWEGRALKTVSGLTKDSFILNKRNKVVSRARSLASQKNIDRLKQYQFKKLEKDNKHVQRGSSAKKVRSRNKSSVKQTTD